MIDLDRFWSFVGHRPGLSATAQEWEACLGPEGWQTLRGRMFYGDGVARVIRRPGDGRTLKVVPLTGGRYGLVCTATGDLVESGLTADEVRCYRLNAQPLRADIASALSVLEAPQRLADPGRLFPVGTWTPKQGHDVPVHMVLPASSAGLCRELHRIAKRGNEGAIVLLPQIAKLDAALREDMKQSQVGLVPLCEILEFDEQSGFRATAAWQTYRDAYCQQFLPEAMVAAGPDCAFEWAGDYWHLTFGGETTHVKDGIGPRYLALLLTNRPRSLYCPDMVALAQGNPLRKISEVADPIADDEAIEQCERHLHETEEELKEAKDWNDVGRQEKLQEEIGFLTEHRRKLLGLHGRTRTFSNSAENARTSVTNAVNRMLRSEAIQKKLPGAYRHLDKAISRGVFMSYGPDPPLDWVLSVTKSQPLRSM